MAWTREKALKDVSILTIAHNTQFNFCCVKRVFIW